MKGKFKARLLAIPLTGLLACSLLVAAHALDDPTAGGSTATTQTLLRGDVNGDGKVTILDACMIQKAVKGDIVLDDAQKAAADVNGDGAVTAEDAQEVANIAAGLN